MNNTKLNRFKIIYGFSFLILLAFYVKEFIAISELGLVFDVRTLVLSLLIMALVPLYFLIVQRLKKKK